MEYFKFQTKLFGEIEITHTGGLFNDYDIALGGNEMKITLSIDENFVDANNIKIIKNLLEHIPEMYQKAKLTILDKMDSNELIKFFIECYFEENDTGKLYEEYHEIFDVDSTAEVTKKMAAKKLEPRMIAIDYLKGDKIQCRFDFSLPEEYTDELLVISFDTQYEICHITHES
jgi:hypothetical protein